jgi:hypothetical protein
VKRSAIAATDLQSAAAMASFDFAAPAEIFVTQGSYRRGSTMAYRRFATAAEAIQYAVEGVPSRHLVGAVLEVRELRFDYRAIRKLYDSAAYPLERE